MKKALTFRMKFMWWHTNQRVRTSSECERKTKKTRNHNRSIMLSSQKFPVEIFVCAMAQSRTSSSFVCSTCISLSHIDSPPVTHNIHRKWFGLKRIKKSIYKFTLCVWQCICWIVQRLQPNESKCFWFWL